jgi:hypothetical protein
MEALLILSSGLLLYQARTRPDLRLPPLFQGADATGATGATSATSATTAQTNIDDEQKYFNKDGTIKQEYLIAPDKFQEYCTNPDGTMKTECQLVNGKYYPNVCVNDDGTIRDQCKTIFEKRREQCFDEDGTLKEECKVVQNNFNPEQFYYNVQPRVDPPVPSPFPPLQHVHPRSMINPVEVEMMNNIRNMEPKFRINGGAGAMGYRPSWVRNHDDISTRPPRQEREQTLNFKPEDSEQMLDERLSQAYRGTYQTAALNTLNEFGKGGLPFDEQIRVAPDGLNPVAALRKPTARYHTYALGEDLTRSAPAEGTVRGGAVGRTNFGTNIRAEGFELTPSRDMGFEGVSGPYHVNAHGVRYGGGRDGVMASPGSTMGRREMEWDNGATGNKAPASLGALRRLYESSAEDVDPTNAQRGVAFGSAITSNRGFRGTNHDTIPLKDEVDTTKASQFSNRRADTLKASATKAAGETSWKFSFDLKKLFDMSLPDTSKNRSLELSSKDDIRGKVVDMKDDKQVQRLPLSTQDNDRKEANPLKKVVFSDSERRDFQRGTAGANKRRQTDYQPNAKNVGNFSGVSVFKSTSTAEEKTVPSSAIRSTKRTWTQTAAPIGSNLSGRAVPIKKSSVTAKLGAEDNRKLYDNDKILDRAAQLSAPLRAPKSSTPDYAQPRVSTMRNIGEFRKR